MGKQPAPPGAATRFSGNVQSILSQLPAPAVPGGSLGGLQPLVMQAGAALPPTLLHLGAAEPALPAVPLGLPGMGLAYGKGIRSPRMLFRSRTHTACTRAPNA